jgi:predicted Zn-dependent protease
LTLWLCAFGLSAELPALASSKASAALVAAAASSPRTLIAAQDTAAEASRLDPLSDAGLTAEATIALHRGRIGQARVLLERGLERDPTDERAWDLLAYLDGLAGDRRGVAAAYRRVLALDPRGSLARGILRAELLAAPAADSVTAMPTPAGTS